MECLAGLPVEVEFFSFDDLLTGGIPAGLDVLINDGEADTAWSGGRYWVDPAVVAAVRRFVYEGGGFIGGRAPSACEHGGRFFQLSDVLGVQKEVGRTPERLPVRFQIVDGHFITDDDFDELDFAVGASYVCCCDSDTAVLAASDDGHVQLAANTFGAGRAVYLAGLPFNLSNCRLLYRALLWAARQEALSRRWFSSNPQTDCAFYPETRRVVVVNNTGAPQQTTVYDAESHPTPVDLAPYESRWFQT